MSFLSKNKLVGLLIFAVSLTVYWLTLCPTVPPRDSGELITAAYTLGIAHPPGYPLFTLLGKLFTFIPWGTIAWRVNLMSAVFASASVTLLYSFILGLTGSVLAGAVAALLLSFSPFYWNLAVVTEVFQLNAFFTILTIYLLWLWKKNKDFRWLLAFSFSYGLSFSNHHTMALLAPGFLYWIWVTERSIFSNWRRVLACAVVFALGLLPYLYLPLRSLADPYLNWGDPRTLERFLAQVTRKQFGSFRLDPALPQAAYTPEMLWANFRTYAGWLFSQFVFAGALLGLAGAVINYLNDKKTFLWLFLLFLFSGFCFVLLAAYPFHVPKMYLYCAAVLNRFMLPSFLVFAVWIGVAISKLEAWAKTTGKTGAIPLLFLLLPLLSLALHYRQCDKSNYYYVGDLIENIMMSARPNAVIFGSSDTTLFSLWYMQGCEGKRPDLKIISSTPHRWRGAEILRRWPELLGAPAGLSEAAIKKRIDDYRDGAAFFADLVGQNAGRNHLYTDTVDAEPLKPFFARLAPSGMLFELLPTTDPRAKLENLRENYQLWEKYRFRSPLSGVDFNDYAAREILTFYAEGHNFSGLVYALNRQFARAEEEFQLALALYPNYPSAALNLAKLRRLSKPAK